MTFTLFLSLAFAHLVAVISPGPDFFYIVKSAFQRGFINSFFSAIGIGFGVFLQCLFSILGLSVLYNIIPNLYLIIGSLGACYLAYIGLMGLISSSTPISNENPTNRTPVSAFKSFFGGVTVNVLNVKAFVFFAALFGGVIDELTLNEELSISLYFFIATALWFIFLSFTLAKGIKTLINVETQNKIITISSVSLIIVGIGLGVYIWT